MEVDGLAEAIPADLELMMAEVLNPQRTQGHRTETEVMALVSDSAAHPKRGSNQSVEALGLGMCPCAVSADSAWGYILVLPVEATL